MYLSHMYMYYTMMSLLPRVVRKRQIFQEHYEFVLIDPTFYAVIWRYN